MKNNFNQTTNNVLEDFNVTKELGLSSTQVQDNFKKYGFNELIEKKKKSFFIIFLEQFKDFLVAILIAAGIISMFTGNVESTIVIFAVITMNSILGTVQNIKAEQSLKSLKALSSPNAKVIRGGEKIEIAAKDVLPGDILVIEAGDLIAADGRVLESYSLKVNESSLTGESEAVEKFSEPILKDEVAIGDQRNMVFSGSLVTYGRGLVLITSTGMNTELGKIASLMEQTKEKKTPLQRTLDEFSKKLAITILVICALVFALSLYRQSPILDSLMFAVALAVAAIPEALSSIVTIVLAMGTQKMAKENSIIKNLKSVEGLGCVSVICSDKTGTLTQNKMTTKKIYVDQSLIESDSLNLKNTVHNSLLNAAILCNDSTSIDNKEIGDPTEVALVNLGHIYSIDELYLRNKLERINEIPFDSDRKLMSTLHQIDDKFIIYTKGALDVLLDRLTHIDTSSGVRKITEDDKRKITDMNMKLSKNGLRILAFAYKTINSNRTLTLEDEDNYTFLGLISMIDPPRVESKKAVADCKLAGIKPIMITGDHKITASAIAKEIGILTHTDIALEGLELDKLSDEELDKKLEHISVYARVSPEHKIRIVEAWQRKGKITAMTGDGVNDAPALKQADIGIAMGITGTEVSKDAASMILTDDNFATIVKAIANGRSIYSNIKNSIKFLLSGNLSGIIAVLYASLSALPVPFAAVHLLFINLLTDSLPAIAIGMEKPKRDLLSQKPRDSKESILTRNFIKETGIQGLLIAIFTIISYHIGLSTGNNSTASTMAFSTLCLARLFHGFNCRSSKSIVSLGLLSNKYSIYAFGAGIVSLNLILFAPVFQKLFEVEPLNLSLITCIYILAFLPTLFIQIYRIISVDTSKTVVDKNSKSTEEKIAV